MLDIMENYIGVPPACISADLRRDLNDGVNVGNRKWHRDTEESVWRREVKVCVYLSDVTSETPHFQYIPLAENPSLIGGSKTNEQMEQLVPRAKWQNLWGPRGTVLFLASNRFYHRAHTPLGSSKDRLTAWYVYTTPKPFGAEQCKTEFSKEAMSAIEPQLTERQNSALCWY
jgi:hypothetical protein